MEPLGAKIMVVVISVVVPTVRRKQRRGAKQEGREDSNFLISKAVLLGLFTLHYLGLSREVFFRCRREEVEVKK